MSGQADLFNAAGGELTEDRPGRLEYRCWRCLGIHHVVGSLAEFRELIEAGRLGQSRAKHIALHECAGSPKHARLGIADLIGWSDWMGQDKTQSE